MYPFNRVVLLVEAGCCAGCWLRVAERVAVRARPVEALPRELPRPLLPAAVRAAGPRHLAKATRCGVRLPACFVW